MNTPGHCRKDHRTAVDKGMPIAWNHRFAGSSVIARYLPPVFNNGLDPIPQMARSI